MIEEEEQRKRDGKRVKLRGRGEMGKAAPTPKQSSWVDMEGMVGRQVECTVSLNSLLP